MDRLKVGVVIDNNQLPAWIVKVLESIADTQHYSISMVIIAPVGKTKQLPILFNLYQKRDNGILHGQPGAFELKDASALLNNLPQHEMHNTDTIRKNAPDVILNLSNSPVNNELLAIPIYGVWEYFHSRYRKAAVPGSLEVLQLEPVTESGIECISSDGKPHTIYRSYALTDPSSVNKSRNRYYWKSVSFASRLLEQLYQDPEHFLEQHVVDDPQKIPAEEKTAITNISFAIAWTGSFVRRVINKLKRPTGRPDWALMYKSWKTRKDPFSLDGYKQLLPPAGHFWADPCIVFTEGKYYAFIEDYDYSRGRGHIAVIELNEQGNHSAATPILERSYHLSYPFIFQHEGKWYMIPESSENRTIELYECESFPYKWKFRKNLAENITAVDTTVLYKDNKWWLFTNVEEYEGAMTLDELFLFYTDDLINAGLTPHPKNPVVSDVRSARPAGRIFPVNGKLMRPSQICTPYYGWGTSINEITQLTETDYQEKAVASIEPDLSKRIAGVHTISISNELSVIDSLLYYKR